MASEFTVTFKGQLPDGWSGNELMDILQKGVNVKPLSFFQLQLTDLQAPGTHELPIQTNLEYKDYDNSRPSWQ